MDNVFTELLETIEQKNQVAERIKIAEREFERQTETDIALFSELSDKEQSLRASSLESLENSNNDSVVIGDKKISRSIRITPKIEDTRSLMKSIHEKIDDIIDLCEVSEADIKFAFENKIEIKDKPLINSIINKYEKVNGKLLDGVTYQETKFITVK